jgi:hypothetical protein
MLSELKCEGRGIGGNSSGQRMLSQTILLNFFRRQRNFFRAAGVS